MSDLKCSKCDLCTMAKYYNKSENVITWDTPSRTYMTRSK